MEDKIIDLSSFYTSIKTIESLLRELLWRQILHTHNGDIQNAEDEFKRACLNMSADLKQSFDDLQSK